MTLIRCWTRTTIWIVGAAVAARTTGLCAQQAINAPSVAGRAWRIVDDAYAAPGFDRQRWALARPRTVFPGADSRGAYASVRALLRRLGDPEVGLVEPTERKWMLAQFTAQPHVGIGLAALLSIDINDRDGHLVIVTPTPGTPAARAGLRTGDEVLAIDGVATDTMDLLGAVDRLNGSVGSTVRLKIRRDSTSMSVTLARQVIGSLPWVVRDTILSNTDGAGFGYVAVRQFTPGADTLLRAALSRMVGAAGIILDLRDNPGGDLAACSSIAGLFVGAEPIARRVGSGHRVTMMFATGRQITAAPVVVLVNRGTASAAEVLSAGLRSAGRATIVGERTFGKALVHTLADLDGQASLLLTVGRLQTLSGQEILRVGVAPDVRVSASASETPNASESIPMPGSDAMLAAALHVLVAGRGAGT
jgi:carboxyl-terminal processing protease